MAVSLESRRRKSKKQDEKFAPTLAAAADTSTSQAPLLSLLHGLEEASTGLVHTKAGRPEMGFLLPLHYTGYFWMRGRAHENGNHERRQCSAKKRESFLKPLWYS